MDSLINLALDKLPEVVSMIGMFIQERRHQKGLTHHEFLAWLETHHFEELKRIITTTHGLEREIDVLLQAQQSEILAEIRVLSESMSLVASRMEIWSGVSRVVSPRVHLSDQALWMLRKLDKAENYHPFMNIMTYSGGILVSICAVTYTVEEPRFIRDDFTDLGNVGFIRIHKHNDHGEPVFGITRLGAEFVKTLPELPPDEKQGELIG